MSPGIRISVRADLNALTASFNALARRQIPFATAQALNATAARVQEAEKEQVKAVFPTVTPFTLGSVAVQRARKTSPEAVVYLRDIAAAYLGPFIDGGVHHLNSRALLNPKAIDLNQYGNIPRGKLAALKGKPGVFIGTVVTKKGEHIAGVWQRTAAKIVRGKMHFPKGANATGHLRLLVRFGDALQVKQHLPWSETARRVVQQHFRSDFEAAFAKALATAR